MKGKFTNRGFSLVELIVVVAILAVIVGVLAPRYAKYLEKTKWTRDCTTISVVLDACETIALDPSVNWAESDPIEIKIESTGTTYTGGASALLNEFVPSVNVKMEIPTWGDIEIEVTRADNGRVTFDIADNDQITIINRYSTDVGSRLE